MNGFTQKRLRVRAIPAVVLTVGLSTGFAAVAAPGPSGPGGQQGPAVRQPQVDQDRAQQRDRTMDRAMDRSMDRSMDRGMDRAADRDRDRLRVHQDQPIYGQEVMTEQERLRYREQLQAIPDEAERNRFREQHREEMQERAQARGITLQEAEEPGVGDQDRLRDRDRDRDADGDQLPDRDQDRDRLRVDQDDR